jgi:predicted DNA-binding antitoxin AbrB/MazE fold protein
MTRITEAVFSGGVLKPVGDLALRESERVRVIVQSLEDAQVDRSAALQRLLAGINGMQFFSVAPLPSRDDLQRQAR